MSRWSRGCLDMLGVAAKGLPRRAWRCSNCLGRAGCQPPWGFDSPWDHQPRVQCLPMCANHQMPSCSNHQPCAATLPHLDEQAGHAQHGLQAGLRLLRRLQRQQRHGIAAAAAGAEGAPQPDQ